MRIMLDDNSYIEVKVDNNKKMNLVFRTKKDEKTILFVTAKLNSKALDDLVSQIVSLKTKVE